MGLEWIALAMLFALFSSSLFAIGFAAWRGEARKHGFVDALRALPGVHVDGVKSGDLARPLELIVEVDGATYACAAVVRGDRPLWHVERAGLDLPVDRRLVVVDKELRAWSRAARALAVVEGRALGARLLALAPGGVPPPLVDVEALARVLDGPGRPIATVVDRERVFVEAPRGKGLATADLVRAVALARAVEAVVAGAPAPALPPARIEDTHAVATAPSGIPVLVPR